MFLPHDPLVSDVDTLPVIDLANVSQPVLCLCHVISQDRIDAVIVLSSLLRYILLELLPQQHLQLLLLLRGQVMSVGQKLLQLFVGEL